MQSGAEQVERVCMQLPSHLACPVWPDTPQKPLGNELACTMKGGNICCQQLIDDLLAFIGC